MEQELMYSSPNEFMDYPIKVLALGGLDEMGKNCYVIEIDNDAYVIEAGLKYPPISVTGIDYIIPDFDYLKNISSKIKGIIISHGHDDQYGAIGYLLNTIHAPIYASQTTISIIKTSLGKRFRKVLDAEYVTVEPSSTLTIGSHVFEFFQTTHSVAQSFGFAIKTEFGNIVYTSDFMSDYSNLSGFQFDLPKVARLSENNKTFLLMMESESCTKPGIASPSHQISEHIRQYFEDSTGKIFISLYSQNFYNIQEVIDLSRRYRKKILIANPEEVPFFDAMREINEIVIPDDMRISFDQISRTSSNDIVVLITGSGSEVLSYLKDICYGAVQSLKINKNDVFVIATPSVPGTESVYTDVCDTVYRSDCHVIALDRKKMSSMHAQEEDLKMMLSLFRPKYYMPIKGEYRLLLENAKLAMSTGIGLNYFNTFVYDNGMVLCIDKHGNAVKKMFIVKAGDILVDGNSVGDVKEASIVERQQMSDSGIVVLSSMVSNINKTVSNPTLDMKGFMYLSDNDSITIQITSLLTNSINDMFAAGEEINLLDAEKKIESKLKKLIFKLTSKEPIIIVKLIDIDNIDPFDPR